MPTFRVPVNFYIEADTETTAYVRVVDYVYEYNFTALLPFQGVKIVDVEGEQVEEIPPDVMKAIVERKP